MTPRPCLGPLTRRNPAWDGTTAASTTAAYATLAARCDTRLADGSLHTAGSLASQLFRMSETRPTPEQIRQRVHAQGWDVVSVPAQAGTPPQSYTVGLARRGLHEFIVFGFSPELARPVLGDLAQRARDGERFPTNVGLEDVLPGMPAVLLDVPSVEADHYLPAARDCAPMNLRALQIVWPDGRDLFPWQDGYDETFRGRQIVLHPFARTGGRR